MQIGRILLQPGAQPLLRFLVALEHDQIVDRVILRLLLLLAAEPVDGHLDLPARTDAGAARTPAVAPLRPQGTPPTPGVDRAVCRARPIIRRGAPVWAPLPCEKSR